MGWLLPAVTATILNTFILLLVYLYLYFRDRANFLLLWCLAWFFYLLRFFFTLAMIEMGSSVPLLIGNQMTALFSAGFLMAGNYLWHGKRVSILLIVSLTTISLWIVFSITAGFSFMAVTLPPFLFIGVIFVITGIELLREKETLTTGVRVTAFAFVLWGIHKVDYPFLQPVKWFAPWGYLIGAVLAIVVAVGIVLIYLERVQWSLVAANERFRQLADNIPQVFWIMTSDFREIIYVSPSFESLWQMSIDEILKNPRLWIESIKDDDRGGVLEVMKNVSTSGRELIFPDYRIILPDGEERWIETRAFPVRDEKGRIYRVAGSEYDLKKKYNFTGININRNYQEEMPPLPCISSEIEQVLINILKNAAIAFNEKNISPEERKIEIATRYGEGIFEITVEDNGPGIDERVRSRLFEPFFTTRKEGEATGLGMFVSYFIITSKYGGSIDVESKVGMGSRFIVRIPEK